MHINPAKAIIGGNNGPQRTLTRDDRILSRAHTTRSTTEVACRMKIDHGSTVPNTKGQNIKSPATLNKIRRRRGKESGEGMESSGSSGRASDAVIAVPSSIQPQQCDQRLRALDRQSTICPELACLQALEQRVVQADGF